MRAFVVVLGMVSVLFSLPYSANCTDMATDPQRALGKYKGVFESYNGKRLNSFDYTVNIVKVDTDNKEVTIKIECHDCEKKSFTHSGCKIIEMTPALTFRCEGEGRNSDYVLTGDSLKGKGINKKGYAFSLSVRKVPSTEK